MNNSISKLFKKNSHYQFPYTLIKFHHLVESDKERSHWESIEICIPYRPPMMYSQWWAVISPVAKSSEGQSDFTLSYMGLYVKVYNRPMHFYNHILSRFALKTFNPSSHEPISIFSNFLIYMYILLNIKEHTKALWNRLAFSKPL